MKILNLYAGIGGNRKLWGDEHEITAVEIDKEIADIYQHFFPNDKVIVGDAHEYLLNHMIEFDFIWSSPPCPTHSCMRFLHNNKDEYPKKYPDMKLYEEILLLKHFFKKGKWVVENVKSYYQPLIKPTYSNNHYFWSNFNIPKFSKDKRYIRRGSNEEVKKKEARNGFKLRQFGLPNGKMQMLLNNCVRSDLGKAILDEVINYTSHETQQVLVK